VKHLAKEREQSEAINVFAPGVPLKEFGVSLKNADPNTSVVMVSLRVPRI